MHRACLVLVTIGAVDLASSQINRCLGGTTSKPPFTLPALKIRREGWVSAQLATNVAAILLNEQLGFPVEFVPPGMIEDTSRPGESYTARPSDVYKEIAEGAQHIAIEIFPTGKEAELAAWGSFNDTTYDDTRPTARVHRYDDVKTFHGLYEACRRDVNGLNHEGGCVMASDAALPRRMGMALNSAEGQAHFARTQSMPSATAYAISRCSSSGECDADGIYRPAACRPPNGNCSALQVLHVRCASGFEATSSTAGAHPS